MSKSIINGKLMDEDSMSGTALKIQRAGARMVARGFLTGNNNNDLFQAKLVLAAQNITVSRETKSFSLASSTNKDEGIDNPNIIDPDLAGLTPEPVSAEDKFPIFAVEQVTSTTSPFYEQDEELSEQQKQSLVRSEKNESAVVVKLASVFSNVSSPSIEDKSINKYTTKNTFRINIDE